MNQPVTSGGHPASATDPYPDPLDAAGEQPLDLAGAEPAARFEVRRHGPLNGAVGVAAAVVAIAYLGRASDTGGVLDWTLCVVLAGLALVHLAGFLDSRTPLLVADGLGVRLRFGRTWQGVPWTEVERVEVARRRGLLRDGALRVHPVAETELLADLDPAARRRAGWARRLRGAEFSVPFSLATRVVADGPDPVAALRALTGTVAVVDLDAALDAPEPAGIDAAPDADASREAPAAEPTAPLGDYLDALGEAGAPETSDVTAPASRRGLPDLRPGLARGIGALAARLPRRRVEAGLDVDQPPAEASIDVEQADEPIESPAPSRTPAVAVRSELLLTDTDTDPATDADDRGATAPAATEPVRELRRPGHVSLVEDTVAWSGPLSRPASTDPADGRLLIDDLADHAAAEPAADPVIGPALAAARSRLGLTVDQLADRTRIRPHVIESVEVDDFVPCGGDFYARGHLRTLARVLGLDAAPLLAAYDERYADAEISPRRVFEAELAAGPHGSIRGTRGGPNWSVLVAAVMAVVLIWSVARLLTDGPVARDDTPVLNGSPGLGLAGGGQKLADPVPVVLTAAGGGAHVVVRDGAGTVVFTGDVAFGDSRALEVSPPVRVQSSDGSLEVAVGGAEQGALGATGEPAQNTFLAP